MLFSTRPLASASNTTSTSAQSSSGSPVTVTAIDKQDHLLNKTSSFDKPTNTVQLKLQWFENGKIRRLNENQSTKNKEASGMFFFPSSVSDATIASASASPFFPLVAPVTSTNTTAASAAVTATSSNLSVVSDTFGLDEWSLAGLSKIAHEVIDIHIDNENLQQIIQSTKQTSPPPPPARYLENYASPPSVGLKRGRADIGQTLSSSSYSASISDDTTTIPYNSPKAITAAAAAAASSHGPAVVHGNLSSTFNVGLDGVSLYRPTNTNMNAAATTAKTKDAEMEEEMLAAIQICSDLISLRTITNGFKTMNRRANTAISNALRPIDGYITYNSEDIGTFLNCFMNVNCLFTGVRYFMRHRFSSFRSVVEKQNDIHCIFQSIIFFLRNLVNKINNTCIRNASVVFVTDSRPLYLDLFSVFANHPSWGNFKKGNISTYTVCTKVASTADRALTANEKLEMKAEQKKLSELEAKFRDVTSRYVFVVTNYADTVSLFNNFGNFRQKRFSNMCVISLDL